MSESGSAPGTWKLVKVPAIITLVVTLVRLIGELADLPAPLFSAEAGGGMALVGIAWLIPIFGVYFGWRLARAGRAPEVPGRAMIIMLAGLVALVVLFLVVVGIPDEGETAEPPDTDGFMIVLAGAWICSLAVLFSWSALYRTLLVYGLAARIPVVVVTFLAVAFGWQTHHVRLPPEAPEMEGVELAVFASVPQIALWVPVTVLLGGLFGGLGALFRRRRTS